MDKKELMAKKTMELRKLALDLGVKNASRKRKEQLVDELVAAYAKKATDEAEVEKANNGNIEVPDVTAEGKRIRRSREDYIERAPKGAIMLFLSTDGQCRTAKIINRSTVKRKYKVETKHGAQFIVPFESVIWVRMPGKRWPRSIFALVTGEDTYEEWKQRGKPERKAVS